MLRDGVLKAPTVEPAVAGDAASAAANPTKATMRVRGGGTYGAVSMMEVRYPVVLFDLDGTLVDSAGVILASFHHATETVLQRRYPDEQSLAQVGGAPLATQKGLLGP